MRIVLLTITVLLASMASFPSKEDDSERLAGALGIKLIEISPADPPDAKAIEKIAGVTGAKKGALEGGAYYWGLFQKSGEELAVHLVRLPLTNLVPAVAVLMAIDENGAFAAAAVVNEDDEQVAGWENLVGNLRYSQVPELANARPRSELQRIRERSEKAKDADGRLTAALLDVLVHMHEQASVFNIPEGTNPLSSKEQALMMADQYDNIAVLSDSLSPLLGDKTETFAGVARESAAVAKGIAEGGGEMDRTAQRKLFANCRSCHDMQLEGGEAKKVFTQARERFGIGDGFYQMGHDIRVSHADRKAAQRVADTLRAAVLLLEAAE